MYMFCTNKGEMEGGGQFPQWSSNSSKTFIVTIGYVYIEGQIGYLTKTVCIYYPGAGSECSRSLELDPDPDPDVLSLENILQKCYDFKVSYPIFVGIIFLQWSFKFKPNFERLI